MPELSLISRRSSRTENRSLREASGFVEKGLAKNEAAELWLCIDLPHLPIDALSSEHTTPAVVVRRNAGRIEVLDCNRNARQQGIVPAMPLAAALSLQRGLQVYSCDPCAERQKLGRLADWSLTFSDHVVLYGNRSLVLEIRGSLRLFGGLRALLEKVASGLDEFACEYGTAVAPSPKAALWLAESRPGQVIENPQELPATLRALPVSKVARDARHLARMQKSGIRTLGDLMRLPRYGVARRFGAQTLEALDLALAKRPEAFAAYHCAPSFSGERIFYLPTCDLNLIRPAAKILLEEFEAYLKTKQLATRLFHCELLRNAETIVRIAVGFRRPAHRAEAMKLLLEEHLGNRHIDAEASSIRIVCSDFEPLLARQTDLFQTKKADERSWSGLIEQLEARLGRNALKRLSLHEDHRPEKASLLRSSQFRHGMPSAFGRPLWLLEKPERLDLWQGEPCWQGPLKRLGSCERIEQGWWDGFEINRDYWIAENSRGSRLWIYRDRRCKAWFLHGVFA